jgi:hypothetical protein
VTAWAQAKQVHVVLEVECGLRDSSAGLQEVGEQAVVEEI